MPYKVAWLRALQLAMQRERAQGKAVVLAGDLNLRHRALDSHWTARRVSLPSFRALTTAAANARPELRSAAMRAVDAWPALRSALRAKHHRPFETRNSRNGQTYQRWGVFVEV